MAYNRYIQGIREPSFIDNPPKLDTINWDFIRTASTNQYDLVQQREIEKKVFSVRSGSIKDDFEILFGKDENDIKKQEYVRQYGIKKDNIVNIKNQELATQCKKENTHFKDEVSFLDSICNLIRIHDSIKIKQVLLCKGVIARLAPGDVEEVAFFANNFKVFELDKYAPKKFEYKNVIFCLNEEISEDEVFRFEFDEQ